MSHVFPFLRRHAPRDVYANYLLQTHPSLFLLLDGRAISFNSPTKFAGKSRRARRGKHVAQRGEARHGASQSCHTVDKRIVHISGVIYSHFRAIAFRRNFPYARSLSPWNFCSTKKRGRLPAVHLTRRYEINALRKSVVLSRNQQ